MTEASQTFRCFGATCGVWVTGDGPRGSAAAAVAAARLSLLAWHDRFTRFTATSELSRLNADPAPVVALSSIMARFVEAARAAAEASGGLVDPTGLKAITAAGYRRYLGTPLPLALALRLAPERRPARPHPEAASRQLELCGRRRLRRPPGLGLDSGGIVKGLLADVLAATLAPHEAFAVNCAGDVRVGGTPRPVLIESPFGGGPLHTFTLSEAAVATSGIGRRSWLGEDGRPCHHLLDPSTGRPAFTGIVQASAIAPSGAEAEWRAKAALLSGPDAAAGWLRHGGLLVFDDGSHRVLEPTGTELPSAHPARLAA